MNDKPLFYGGEWIVYDAFSGLFRVPYFHISEFSDISYTWSRISEMDRFQDELHK